jgi:hypothetical protein
MASREDRKRWHTQGAARPEEKDARFVSQALWDEKICQMALPLLLKLTRSGNFRSLQF